MLLGGDEAADPGSAEANLSPSEENKPWLLNRKLPTYVVGVWGAADGGVQMLHAPFVCFPPVGEPMLGSQHHTGCFSHPKKVFKKNERK